MPRSSAYRPNSVRLSCDVIHCRRCPCDSLEEIKDVNRTPEPPAPRHPPLEAALRYLGARKRGELAALLEHAIERPDGTSGTALAPLIKPTAVLTEWTPAERAHALLALIEEGVYNRAVGPTSQSRRRRVLQSAFRLPDPEIDEPWGASLTDRFKQLKKLQTVFGAVNSTQPMETAWARGVEALTTYLNRRFRELQAPSDWEAYRGVHKDLTDLDRLLASVDQAFAAESESYRQPSPGAQQLSVDLFITTVFMKGRAVHRRITERLVTARGADVPYYTARGFAVGKKYPRTYVPIRGLWGCREEFVEPEPERHPRRPPVTRLWFPEPLKRGQQAYFASEAVFEIDDDGGDNDRDWIDVDIDHYGIPSGKLLYGNRMPVRGLTIRVRFDEACLPEAVWWYAEANDEERYIQPPPGDERLLPVFGNAVTHTFTDRVGQPREHYGLSFSWPSHRDK
jgi:hypothetical protein